MLVRQRCFTNLILLLLAILLTAKPVWSSGSVFAGVEQGELFSGGKFELDQNYDLMFSLYEKSGLGSGFYYHNDFADLELVNNPRFKECNFDTANFTLNASDDRILLQKKGGFSIVQDKLLIDGFYDDNDYSSRSGASIDYKLKGMVTQLMLNRDEDTSLNNLEFKEQFGIAGNNFELDYQNNEYQSSKDKVVGESNEIFWTPAVGFLRIGYGHFEEVETETVADRTRLRLEYYTKPALEGSSWTFGGSAEGFYYSQGEERMELSALGQYRKAWNNGSYYQIACKEIQRAGDTPFEFDNDPVHTSEGLGEINWHFGENDANLLANYDLTEGYWDKIKGYLEVPIGNDYSLLWVAQYDYNNLYDPDQTTYLMELEHSGSFTLLNRLEWNHEFTPLEVSSKANMPLEQDLLEVEVSYSMFRDRFNVVRLNYTIDQIGKFSLQCEFDRGCFSLTYSWR